MVIEVVSPTTAGRDRGLKRDLYERNGVREYWWWIIQIKPLRYIYLMKEIAMANLLSILLRKRCR